MESQNSPKAFLVVVAGPNGAGKTTITDKLRSQGFDLGEYINADEITLDLLKDQPFPSLQETFNANKQAQNIADKRRQAALDEGRNLAFETVMSHPSKVDFMHLAKERGYEVNFFFVGTDDPLINLERVKLRVLEGGHDVPPEKIISRYERVMDLLPEAVQASDYAEIYDNSSPSDPIRLASAIKQGKTILFLDDPPHWVNNRLLEALQHGHLKREEGPFKQKALDFATLSTIDLAKKYPNDKNIQDALSVRAAARLFAKQHLQETTAQRNFLALVNTYLAYNLEHGRQNHSPTLPGQQFPSPKDDDPPSP